jgi:hypothetical protein
MSSSHDSPEPADEGGQVSEVASLKDPDQAISPGDATAGYPESESGHPDEGPAGPDAPAKRNRHLEDRRWDDD